MRKLVTAITLVLCLGAASSASAAPRSFFGVVPFEDPSQADFDRIGAGKVGQIRINLYWPAVQPLEGWPYNWSRYDPIVEGAAMKGIRIFPTVYGSPAWAADTARHPPNPEFRDEFEDFLRAAAQRYGPGGAFWSLHPFLPKLPIIDWQIWNEVNSPTFWYSKPKASQYKPLLVAADHAIKGVSPSSHVVLAGLFKKPQVRNAIPMTRYLRQLYATGARPLFDSIAVHPYALTPRRALETVDLARKVMRRHRDGRKPVWITEIGWASSGIRTPVTVSPKKQGKYLRQTFKLAAKSRKRRHIAGIFWFCFQDMKPRFWIYRTGLLRASGKAKPSWRAFVKFTGGRPN